MQKEEKRKTWKTKQFIDTYLVQAEIGKGYGLYSMVAQSGGTDKAKIAKEIRTMGYDKFMLTRYWQLVSLQIKSDAHWRCQKCGHHGNLVTHHLNYRCHGYEMYHLDDLQCLCQHCHEEIHGLNAIKPNL